MDASALTEQEKSDSEYEEPFDEEDYEQSESEEEDDESDWKTSGKMKIFQYDETINVDEDQEHEFKGVQVTKQPVEQISDYAEKYINAFLNTNGGTIYFGVEDDGKVRGIILNRRGRDLLRLKLDNIVSSFKPQVDPNLVRVTFIPVDMTDSERGKRKKQKGNKKKNKREKNNANGEEDPMSLRFVVKVRVSKGRAPVYLTNHTESAYYRLSGSTHKMGEAMIAERKTMGRPYSLNTSYGALPIDFIGRNEEIERIRSYLSTSQGNVKVVLLWGLPLVGKSTLARRLAVEFSSSFPDRSFHIDIKGAAHSYVETEDAKLVVIRAVYPKIVLPTNKSEISGLYESCFSGKRAILVIENVGYPKQIRDLLPTMSASCLVIVTSRRNLDVMTNFDGISICLSALKPEDAVKLLRSIVPKVDERLAAKIVEKCNYMPLPIRVVGSTLNRQPNITPESLLVRLENEDKVLELVEAPFKAAFATYSPFITFHLLCISLFPGSFDGPAAAVFAEEYSKAEDSLGRLLEYGLIEFDPDSLRYKMNDLLRMYCKKVLWQNSSEIVACKERFVQYYTQLLEMSGKSSSEGYINQIFLQERLNLEACVSYCMQLQLEEQSNKFVQAGNHLSTSEISISQLWLKIISPLTTATNTDSSSQSSPSLDSSAVTTSVATPSNSESASPTAASVTSSTQTSPRISSVTNSSNPPNSSNSTNAANSNSSNATNALDSHIRNSI